MSTAFQLNEEEERAGFIPGKVQTTLLLQDGATVAAAGWGVVGKNMTRFIWFIDPDDGVFHQVPCKENLTKLCRDPRHPRGVLAYGHYDYVSNSKIKAAQVYSITPDRNIPITIAEVKHHLEELLPLGNSLLGLTSGKNPSTGEKTLHLRDLYGGDSVFEFPESEEEFNSRSYISTDSNVVLRIERKRKTNPPQVGFYGFSLT